VSTCSKVEKKVERSGRRGGCAGVSLDGWGTLCSTGMWFSVAVREGLEGRRYLRTKPYWEQRGVSWVQIEDGQVAVSGKGGKPIKIFDAVVGSVSCASIQRSDKINAKIAKLLPAGDRHS